MVHLTKIIAAILVLIAIALGGYAWMLSRQAPRPPVAAAASQVPAKDQVPTFPVVVAAKPLPAGVAVPADALRVEQLPINPAGAFKTTEAVAGRVPVFDLGEGTPLLEGQLSSGLALKVGDGERAVAIKADEVMGVGNKVQPGDFVDVFFTLKSDSKDIDRSQVRLLLSRKRVLAFGSASVDGLPSKNPDTKGGVAQQQVQQRTEAARTAVLAVPVEEINRLTLGESSGRLLLALRNPTDMSQPDPALFAQLPTALKPTPPKRGEPERPPLEGLDQAQAGLTVADLVVGGGSQATTHRPTPNAAAPRARAATGARQGSLAVEMIRGDRSETLRY